MVIKTQDTQSIVSVTNDYVIMEEMPVYPVYCEQQHYTIKITTKFYHKPIVLGIYFTEEEANNVMWELYIAIQNNEDYWMPSP